MMAILAKKIARAAISYQDRCIIPPRCYIAPICRPSHSFYGSSMALINSNSLPCCRIPYPYQCIVSNGDDMPVLGRPCQGIDRARMLTVDQGVLPIEGIPHVHSAIKAS